MHECKAIIARHFGDLLFTTVYVILCIIVNIGIMKGTKLTLSLEKAKTPKCSTIIHSLANPRLAFQFIAVYCSQVKGFRPHGLLVYRICLPPDTPIIFI